VSVGLRFWGFGVGLPNALSIGRMFRELSLGLNR